MKKKAIICDIDNTLISIMHRFHMLKGEHTDWNAFLDPELMMKDQPIHDTVEVINCLGQKYPVLFVTGRNEGCREVTEKQIKNCCPNLCEWKLIMRPDSDQKTADVIVKKQLFEQYVAPEYDILCAFDDKQANIDLWRSLGITAYHSGELGTGEGF